MKTLLISINSKYVHSPLAVWYLKAFCTDGCGEIKVSEFTINDNPEVVLASIYGERADIAAFSCYIWNIAFVLKLACDLKKVMPHVRIILGGPEVSFEAAEIMHASPFVDFIISGEGERAFKSLVRHLHMRPHVHNSSAGIEDSRINEGTGGNEGVHIKADYAGIDDIDGLTYRTGDMIKTTGPCAMIEDLDTIPSPYTDEMLRTIGNRIVYFESSRGCPYSCSYCISSTFEGVRFFSLERVRNDLDRLIDAGVRQVKFVDRTFNCNKARAKSIIRHIADKSKKAPDRTCFHFETAGDLFDDEMLAMLADVPAGLVQFEIGIQTTNIRALEAVNRRTDLEKVFNNVKKLRTPGNVHIHLDLIAGLPYEDYESFRNSFDSVYCLKPHMLQLGFLKLLKGSRIRNEANNHLYRFRDYPPYEVLANKYIAYDRILELKGMEELIERYFNSGKFCKSLKFIISSFFDSPFEFYHEFFLYGRAGGSLYRQVSGRELYGIVSGFVKSIADKNKCNEADRIDLLNELLKFDYLSSDNSGNVPEVIKRTVQPGFKEKCFEFLKNKACIEKYLPWSCGMPAKQVYKQVHFEIFDCDVTQDEIKDGDNRDYVLKKTVVLFDYGSRHRVTGLYESQKVEIQL